MHKRVPVSLLQCLHADCVGCLAMRLHMVSVFFSNMARQTSCMFFSRKARSPHCRVVGVYSPGAPPPPSKFTISSTSGSIGFDNDADRGGDRDDAGDDDDKDDAAFGAPASLACFPFRTACWL